MDSYDKRLDLAPRDIISRAIHDQMESRGDSHVLLDIRCAPVLVGFRVSGFRACMPFVQLLQPVLPNQLCMWEALLDAPLQTLVSRGQCPFMWRGSTIGLVL